MIGQTVAIRLGSRTEATVTTAVVRWADRPATGMSDRAEAGNALCHFDADRPAAFAVETDAVSRRTRLMTVNEGGNHVDELMPVDRAAAKFKVDRDVIGNRR